TFTLSQFREFADIVGPLYSMTEFGHNLGIPLADSYEELKCHYSGEPIKALEHVAYYEADPELETVLVGYRCEACGIAVSEEARQKEKLGGKAGKGIAKAKCPKCEQKMGNVPLYTLKETEGEPSTPVETMDDEAADETANAQLTADTMKGEAAEQSTAESTDQPSASPTEKSESAGNQ